MVNARATRCVGWRGFVGLTVEERHRRGGDGEQVDGGGRFLEFVGFGRIQFVVRQSIKKLER